MPDRLPKVYLGGRSGCPPPDHLINAIECNPRYVVLVGPRAIPKTTSGKLRRNKAAEKYHDDGYDRLL